ncbi:MAG: hypothetical protein QOC65_712, partial [Sphingomonadales bacterium]|nr:hypothetical protein [Sphingomonadales bacterium]
MATSQAKEAREFFLLEHQAVEKRLDFARN